MRRLWINVRYVYWQSRIQAERLRATWHGLFGHPSGSVRSNVVPGKRLESAWSRCEDCGATLTKEEAVRAHPYDCCDCGGVGTGRHLETCAWRRSVEACR